MSATAESEAYVVLDVPPKPNCNRNAARVVDLSRITSRPKDYLGQCVAVVGYLAGRALFDAETDAARRGSNGDDRSEGRRVGLYMSDATWRRLGGWGHVMQASVIGVVSHCDCLQGPDVVMVMGYCHQSGGPFLTVSEAAPFN